MQFKLEEISRCPGCKAEPDKFEALQRFNSGSQRVTRQACSECGHRFFKPVPIRLIYDIEPNEYWDKKLFQPNKFIGELKKLRDLLQMGPDTKALDIGAGLGMDMLDMQRAGFEVYGCDVSAPFCRWAVNENKIPGERLKADSIEDVVYGAAYFDFISMNYVLEHFRDPMLALEKAYSWLKPEAVLYINCRTSDVSNWYRILYSLFHRNSKSIDDPFLPPYYLHTYSTKSLSMLAESLGLEILEMRNKGERLTVWLRKIIRS